MQTKLEGDLYQQFLTISGGQIIPWISALFSATEPLPTRARSKVMADRQLTGFSETVGLPESGKSATFEQPSLAKLHVLREFSGLTAQELGLKTIEVGFENSSKLINLARPADISANMKLKFADVIESLESAPDRRIMFQRGLYDILTDFIFIKYIQLYFRANAPQHMADVFEGMDWQMHWLVFIQALNFLPKIDALLLFENDLPTAQDRLRKRGEATTGYMTNEIYWPLWQSAYSRVLGSIVPHAQVKYRMAFLLVNGRASKANNIKRVHKFMTTVYPDLLT